MKKILILLGVILVVAGVTIFVLDRHPSGILGINSVPRDDKWEAAGVNSSPSAARYENKKYGFSFDKPEGFTVGDLNNGDGSETILVQPAPSVIAIRQPAEKQSILDRHGATAPRDDSKNGFQIYITAIAAPIELTPDFIKKDLPGTEVTNPVKIELGDSSAGSALSAGSTGSAKSAPSPRESAAVGRGIMFESNNPAFGGRSFEIWFVYNGYIYQVTSYDNFASELQKIIGTWKFN